MQTKTMLKYHFFPIRLATIHKFANTLVGKCVGEKGPHTHTEWECEQAQVHAGKFGNICQIYKYTNLLGLAISLLGL